MKRIIGVIGNKRHGKDTIANYLVKEYNYKKVSLASPMKEVAKLLFPRWTDEFLENCKELIDEDYGISPREFLQKFGTEFMQEMLSENPLYKEKVGNRFWINKAIKTILTYGEQSKFVISDVRFPHEVEALKSIRHLVKVNFIKVVREDIPIDNSHASEAFIQTLPADYIIENNGSLSELYEDIESILKLL